MGTSSPDKPDISYPTRWSYRIVGTSEEAIRSLVLGLLINVEHELVVRRRSSGGRYISLDLSLIVQDEEGRLAIYERLSRHDTIRFVI